jgi:hypothetical protein
MIPPNDPDNVWVVLLTPVIVDGTELAAAG